MQRKEKNKVYADLKNELTSLQQPMFFFPVHKQIIQYFAS